MDITSIINVMFFLAKALVIEFRESASKKVLVVRNNNITAYFF